MVLKHRHYYIELNADAFNPSNCGGVGDRIPWTVKRRRICVLKEVDETRKRLLNEVLIRIERVFDQAIRANGLETIFIGGKSDGTRDLGRVPH